MSREEAHKLLGGYATGTLTPEERQALFEAALQDQELFDALAREEALREVLGDPTARARLLAAIDDAPAPWYRGWWRLAPVAAMAAALVVVAVVELRQSSPSARPLRVANVAAPAVAPAAPILPPPPEVARAAQPAMMPFSLPGVAPAAPPLPPPPPAAKADFAGDAQRQDQMQFVPAGARAAANGFLENGGASASLGQSFLPVHGTVTDPSGAPVPSVTVEVKSVSTGYVFKTSTNQRGEFSAPGVPGTDYQISASAPGFRTTTVSSVTPLSGTPGPVNLLLNVGAMAETVEVSAAAAAAPRAPAAEPLAEPAPEPPPASQVAAAPVAGMAGGLGGRGVGGVAIGALARKQAPPTAAQPAAATPPAHPDLQYRILRRMPGGDRVEAPAGGAVAVGDTVILRITPPADGHLRITQANGRVIANRAVHRNQPLDAQLPKFNKPARVEFQVSFSRLPFASNGPPAAGGERVTVTLNFQ
jgi:hypothetical protein